MDLMAASAAESTSDSGPLMMSRPVAPKGRTLTSFTCAAFRA